MDTVKQKNMDSKSIKAFIQYGDRPIDESWLRTAMVVNILAFAIGVLFSENKFINGCFSGGMSIGLIVIYVKNIARKKLSKKLLNLFYGIYMTFLSISLSYVAYVLLHRAWKFPIIIALTLFLSIVVVGIAIFLLTDYRIKFGKYIDKKENPISKGIIAISVGIGTMFYRMYKDSFNTENYFLLFGVLIGIVGVLMVSNIVFIMKYYYLQCLEQMRQENV